MPELPEVETVRRGLQRLIVGRTITSIEVLHPKSFIGETTVVGRRFVATRRRAKLLLLDLDDNRTLAVHLKMTGQLVVQGNEHWGGGHPTDSLIGQLPDRSTKVIIGLDDGSQLFFNDQRIFGWIRLVSPAEVEAMTAHYGPEPMDDDAWPRFRDRVHRRTRSPIKAAILDQEVVAGIGNIYADEALWATKLNPATPVGIISDRSLKRLLTAAAEVMTLSIELGGSTDRNYVDAEGKRGSYLTFAQVFRREGQPCSRCGKLIVKTRVAGRGTHWCPKCQPFIPG